MRAIDADLLKKEMWSDYYTNDMYYPNSHEDTLRIVSNIIDSLPTVEGKAHEQNPCDLQECEPPCGGKENCEFRGMDGFCKAYQGPRVMTLEEVRTAQNCMEPVFVEMLDENGKPQETPNLFSWRFVKYITTFLSGRTAWKT